MKHYQFAEDADINTAVRRRNIFFAMAATVFTRSANYIANVLEGLREDGDISEERFHTVRHSGSQVVRTVAIPPLKGRLVYSPPSPPLAPSSHDLSTLVNIDSLPS